MNIISKRIAASHGSIRAFCTKEKLNYNTTKQVLCGSGTSLLVQISLVQNGFATVDEIRALRKKDFADAC